MALVHSGGESCRAFQMPGGLAVGGHTAGLKRRFGRFCSASSFAALQALRRFKLCGASSFAALQALQRSQCGALHEQLCLQALRRQLQARNNARVAVAGSIDMFSNAYFHHAITNRLGAR